MAKIVRYLHGPGMGPLVDGDIVEVEIDGIGTLRNPVRAKPIRDLS